MPQIHVRTGRKDGAVFAQTEGEISARGDGGHALPFAYGAAVIGHMAFGNGSTCGDHGAVVPESHGMLAARSDGFDIRPAADVALPLGMIAHGPDGAVGEENDGVGVACGNVWV